MPGFFGVLHLGGASLAPDVLDAMLARRDWEDAQGYLRWQQGPIALAQARAGQGSEPNGALWQRDGRLWLAGHLRLDDRNRLCRELGLPSPANVSMAADGQLLLAAYDRWGERCLEHLIGDFAFALWDAGRQTLFCARDHMGVRPFFHARVGDLLVFGNRLKGVLQNTAVPTDLDDLGIADFLMFERQMDAWRTCFRAVRRLPAASLLLAGPEGLAERSYWRLSREAEVSYRAAGDYLEHFSELLTQACRDRLRGEPVAMSLSGGVDSPAVAALLCNELDDAGHSLLRGSQTIAYDGLFPDQERHFATLVAKHLHLPQRILAAEQFLPFQDAVAIAADSPEPVNDPMRALYRAAAQGLAGIAPVAFTGDDADGLLNESPRPYFRWLAWRGDWRELAHCGIGHLWMRRATLLRRLVPARRLASPGGGHGTAVLPPWLAPDLVASLGLADRWQAALEAAPWQHPVRPYGHQAVDFTSVCATYFEDYDPAQSGAAVEYRHPFMDLRLVDFCLSLPPWPWCVGKYVLKKAMAGKLPQVVLDRPKTRLRQAPHQSQLERGNCGPLNEIVASGALRRYVHLQRGHAPGPEKDADANLFAMRPLSLGCWLEGQENTNKH